MTIMMGWEEEEEEEEAITTREEGFEFFGHESTCL